MLGVIVIVCGLYIINVLFYLDERIYLKQNCIEFRDGSKLTNCFELNNKLINNLTKPFLIRAGLLKINILNFIIIIAILLVINFVLFDGKIDNRFIRLCIF